METFVENTGMKNPHQEDALQRWAGYEYIGPGDKYHPAGYEEKGGADDFPYVWSDDSMWTLDTPEDPTSILALLTYRNWTGRPILDLRNASVSFYLRGDQLDLKGARCYFWITAGVPTTVRWHYIAYPIDISIDSWGPRNEMQLIDDPEKWHKSFSGNPGVNDDLAYALRTATSYGFSFVGFKEKVSGRICLSDFSLQKHADALWSWAADFRHQRTDWQTVSLRHNKQIIASNGFVQERLGDGRLHKREMACIKDDIMLIPADIPFAYLQFIHADYSTRGRDLSNVILCAATCSGQLDLKGGTIHFFIEHSVSNTRWVYSEPVQEPVTEFILSSSVEKWRRVTGTVPLADVLKGNDGQVGYDYLGFMAVNAQGNPTGGWGLYYLSIGPNVRS